MGFLINEARAWLNKLNPITGQVEQRLLTQTEGEIISSGLKLGGAVDEVDIDDASWTEVSPTPIIGRNQINIQNESGQLVKLRYDDTEPTFKGVYLKSGVERQYTIQGAIKIYARCETGTAKLVVEELA